MYGWRKANKKMLAAVDKEIHAGFIQEQVDLLGGCKELYEVIDKSLCNSRLVPFYREEQKALLEWRKKFFREKFKSEYFRDPRPRGPMETALYWFTDGADDAHCMDTEPYQTTQNFHKVMELAASTVRLDPNMERVYFESYEGHEGRKLESILIYDIEDSDSDGEWDDEDYDYCYLVEYGKLACEEEKYESHWSCKICVDKKQEYIQYLRESDSIKEKYWKWKKEEKEEQEEEGLDEEFL